MLSCSSKGTQLLRDAGAHPLPPGTDMQKHPLHLSSAPSVVAFGFFAVWRLPSLSTRDPAWQTRSVIRQRNLSHISSICRCYKNLFWKCLLYWLWLRQASLMPLQAVHCWQTAFAAKEPVPYSFHRQFWQLHIVLCANRRWISNLLYTGVVK